MKDLSLLIDSRSEWGRGPETQGVQTEGRKRDWCVDHVSVMSASVTHLVPRREVLRTGKQIGIRVLRDEDQKTDLDTENLHFGGKGHPGPGLGTLERPREGTRRGASKVELRLVSCPTDTVRNPTGGNSPFYVFWIIMESEH